jgi:hypothetical protein
MKFSKTVLINALVLVAGLGTYIIDKNLITNNPDVVAAIGLAVSGVNLALRYLTKTAMAGLFHKKG